LTPVNELIGIEVNSLVDRNITSLPPESEIKPIRRSDMTEEEFRKIEINKNLNKEQALSLQKLICKYRDIFYYTEEDSGKYRLSYPGNYEVFKLKEGVKPINMRPYKLSLKERELMKEKCDELVARGIAEYSLNTWSSSAMLVRKPDGVNFRLVADYRYLNQSTEEIKVVLPSIDDIFGHLSKAKWLSTVDIKDGYHSFEIDDRDKEISGFCTPDATLRFKTPQGARNAAQFLFYMVRHIFHYLFISKLYESKENAYACFIYLHDILIFSETFEEHLIHLGRLFQRLRYANLTIFYKKCSFARQELKLSGCMVSQEGIRIDTNKTPNLKIKNNSNRF
jgi:hypothetical protein